MLAALGRSSVRVIRRPVAAILATGDELVEVGQDLQAGSIYDVNSYSLSVAVQRAGGVPRLLGIARDNLDRPGCQAAGRAGCRYTADLGRRVERATTTSSRTYWRVGVRSSSGRCV